MTDRTFRWSALAPAAIAMLLLVAAACLWRMAGPDPLQAAPATRGAVMPTRIGMNLAHRIYWSSEWMFDDLVQGNATLLTRTPTGGWAPLDPALARDAAGRPMNVPAGTQFVVILQKGVPRLPAGTFDCSIAPGWRVAAFGEASIEGGGPRFRLKIPAVAPNNGVALYVTATRAGASLSQLACLRAGAPGPAGFNPAFLADNRPFDVLRFKDAANIDGAPPRSWATRTTPAAFSQADEKGAGMALEHMVALANTLGVDPWFSLPLDAEGDYYARFATYVRDHLAPDRKVYVELSNEVWNTGFPQGKEATARGQRLYPGVPASTANDFYYADRTRALMAVWGGVFRGQEKRLVRVLASQAVNPARAEQALSHEETWRSVDALATAPYLSDDGADAPSGGKARLDLIFSRMPRIVDVAIGHALAAKAVAARHGLRYIAYEGGAGIGSYNRTLHDDLVAANRDPRMYDLYRLFLRRWQAEVGDLIVFFDSISTASPLGLFGHKDYTGQPLADAPKMRALVDFAAASRAPTKP